MGNLFDERDAPIDRRPEKLKRKIAADLKVWTPSVLAKKIENLAEVTDQMNDGLEPDILGVCEVENAHVLLQLIGEVTCRSTYKLVHHDMGDQRGIDVAFIYDKEKYSFDDT